MILAAHQPNFLPWLGFFYKMGRADAFVLADSLAFTRRSYINRVQIKTPSGPEWLTVPVLCKGRLNEPILDVKCNSTAHWQRKVKGALEMSYRRCPHFQPHGEAIGRIVASAGDSLVDLNLRLIEYVAAQLDIPTPVLRSSRLKAAGSATDFIIALCREVGADTYLSGSGGANYQDEAVIRAAGIKLVYTRFQHPVYPQAFGDFLPGLSAIDLLFNCGPESRRILGL